MSPHWKFGFAVLSIAGLVACGSQKPRVATQPPPAATAPAVVAKPAPSPAPPAPPQTPAPAPPQDAVAQLIQQAEKLYASGMDAYKAGNLDQARQNFDQAVALLLQSNFDLNRDERLSSEFDKLVENISAVEVAAAEHGEIVAEHKYEPAPIESFAQLTFPVDPNVKARAQKELHSVHSDLPLVSNDYVDGVLTYFQGRGRDFIERVLKRKGLYEKMISEELAKAGMPQDLIYVAAGESAFNPFAVSRARAVGIWQFVLGTARLYGLKRDRWVDEREDPQKSTQAAVAHLKDLYQEFGDWYLAMAAYDSGPVTIQKAIERTGYADFWKLRELRALPRETENYVPIFLATAMIGKDPKAYGFDVTPDPPVAPDRVEVTSPTDVRLVAQLIDHPVEDLIQLNPSMLRWSTPPDDAHFVLNLPAGTGETFQKLIAKIPEDKRVWWRVHRAQEGDTLASIASRYHITKASLSKANQLDSSDSIQPGDMLVLPLPTGSEWSLARVRTRGPRYLYNYRVRPGDTIELIADRFDVTPYEIRRWNRLKSSRLTTGRVLRLYVAGEGRTRRRRTRRRSTPTRPKAPAAKQSTAPSVH